MLSVTRVRTLSRIGQCYKSSLFSSKICMEMQKSHIHRNIVYEKFLPSLNVVEYYKRSSRKYQLNMTGAIIYETLADELDYSYFFNTFQMEDTFFSWFLITEMHVWILLQRVVQNKNDGLQVRNSIVETMWNDVKVRGKKLGHIDSSIFNEQLSTLSSQFNASLVGYDEAISSSDSCLANHIWQRFFKSQNIDIEKLEKLVFYVREQVNIINQTTDPDIISIRPVIKWIHNIKKLD